MHNPENVPNLVEWERSVLMTLVISGGIVDVESGKSSCVDDVHWVNSWQFLLIQHCFFFPEPLYLGLSRHIGHIPQSSALNPLQIPHQVLLVPVTGRDNLQSMLIWTVYCTALEAMENSLGKCLVWASAHVDKEKCHMNNISLIILWGWLFSSTLQWVVRLVI